MRPKEELLALGLKPMAWDEVLKAVQEKLGPADRDLFLRHHRNFVGYLSQDTLERFYAFVFSHDLHLEVNGFRFHRIEGILEILLSRIVPGQCILDVGAGAGLIAAILLNRCMPKTYVTQDLCRGARDFLLSMGFAVLPHPAPERPPGGLFDLILCADSLGEINSDDQGALAGPDPAGAGDLSRMIAERYGFAEKLEPWKSYLAEGGKVFLWEPIARRKAWEAIGTDLEKNGWKTRLHGDMPRHSYLELTLA